MKRSEVARYDAFLGIDVGKSSNCAALLDRSCDGPLMLRKVAQDEGEVRALISEAAELGELLVTVDQYGAFGRLVVAVARDMGVDVAHITPHKFRQVAETYGEGKSDAKDAFVIADVSRSQPRNIDPVPERAEVLAEVKVVTSARDDCVRERTRLYNRLHDLIAQSCPALEALFSKEKLHNDLEIRLVAKYGGPSGFRRAGRSRASKWAGSLKWHKTNGPDKVAEVFEAISSQKVALPASEAIERQARKGAAQIIELVTDEAELNAELERLSESIPEVAILRSIPGVGPVYGATIAAEVADVSRFGDAAHLASYAGVAPVRETSGTSVDKKKRRKGGNRRLKNAVVRSAQCAVQTDERAAAYYEKKRAEGKGHKQALRALARRRVDVIYALLSNGTFYEAQRSAR